MTTPLAFPNLDDQHRFLTLSLTQRHAKQTLLDSVSLQLQRERRRHTRSQRAWGLLVSLAEPGVRTVSHARGMRLPPGLFGKCHWF